MRTKSKKISLLIFALTAVLCGCIAMWGMSVRTTSAATSLNTLDSFRVERVSVRLAVGSETNGGFRFETLIPQSTYDSFTDVTEIGTLFVPSYFNVADASIALDEYGNVLHEKVKKIVLEGGEENRRGGLATTDDSDVDVISYRAYINDIPETAFATEVTARSYIIADGETYYTETVSKSVGEVATTAYYDVKSVADETYCNSVAGGYYSPFIAAQLLEIGEYIQTSDETYADPYVVVSDGSVELDLTQISVDGNDVIGVTVDDEFVEWSVNNDTLTYATASGEKTLSVATATCVYDVQLIQADNVITTGEQFTQWIHKNRDGFGSAVYTVLANDITTTGNHYMNVFPENRVFNGLGHTINGFTSGMGIVSQLSAGSEWKNVNYTNYSGDLVLYNLGSGVFENVNITGTVQNTAYLLAYTINSQNPVIKNCMFNLKHQTAGTTLNLAKKGATYNNITLIDTTIVYSNGELTINDLDLTKCSNYNIYDESDVSTNYYATVSGGTATFDVSQMGGDAITSVNKLTVNGQEVAATLSAGVLSYPATNVGDTLLMITTNEDNCVMKIVHADNVLTTWAEFSAWVTNSSIYNAYEYTVLANDITASGTTYSNGGHFSKTFDGLGHTIANFKCGHGIVQRLLAGATWKNVNYTNITTTGQGLFGYLAGGTFENVNISGTLGSETFIFAYGINTSGTKFVGCTLTLTNADRMEKCLCGGEVHYYEIKLVNTTVNYNGVVNYQTCTCNSCNGAAAKITLTNSVINSNYGA